MKEVKVKWSKAAAEETIEENRTIQVRQQDDEKGRKSVERSDKKERSRSETRRMDELEWKDKRLRAGQTRLFEQEHWKKVKVDSSTGGRNFERSNQKMKDWSFPMCRLNLSLSKEEHTWGKVEACRRVSPRSPRFLEVQEFERKKKGNREVEEKKEEGNEVLWTSSVARRFLRGQTGTLSIERFKPVPITK